MTKLLVKNNSDLETISDDGNGENSIFLAKLWHLVERNSNLAKWGGNGKTILIDKTETDYLVKHFKTKNIPSFVRQLNMYGFRKVRLILYFLFMNKIPYFRNFPKIISFKVHRGQLEFSNHNFVRGQPKLLRKIRRKSKSRLIIRPTLTNEALGYRLKMIENDLEILKKQFEEFRKSQTDENFVVEPLLEPKIEILECSTYTKRKFEELLAPESRFEAAIKKYKTSGKLFGQNEKWYEEFAK